MFPLKKKKKRKEKKGKKLTKYAVITQDTSG